MQFSWRALSRAASGSLAGRARPPPARPRLPNLFPRGKLSDEKEVLARRAPLRARIAAIGTPRRRPPSVRTRRLNGGLSRRLLPSKGGVDVGGTQPCSGRGRTAARGGRLARHEARSEADAVVPDSPWVLWATGVCSVDASAVRGVRAACGRKGRGCPLRLVGLWRRIHHGHRRADRGLAGCRAGHVARGRGCQERSRRASQPRAAERLAALRRCDERTRCTRRAVHARAARGAGACIASAGRR